MVILKGEEYTRYDSLQTPSNHLHNKELTFYSKRKKGKSSRETQLYSFKALLFISSYYPH